MEQPKGYQKQIASFFWHLVHKILWKTEFFSPSLQKLNGFSGTTINTLSNQTVSYLKNRTYHANLFGHGTGVERSGITSFK